MATLCIIVALSFTILIHELGHMIVLKRNGFKVNKFSLGIPLKSLPSWTIWKDKSGTKYTVELLLIGGAVSMNRDEEERVGTVSLWVKTKIYMSGMFMNALLAFIILSTIYFCQLYPKSGILYSAFWSLIAAFLNSFVLWFCAVPLLIGKMIAGTAPIAGAIAGPIGIVQIMHSSFSTGIVNFLFLIALINVSLAAMNLLPIFPLDGGHMFIALIERFFPKCKKFIGLFQRLGFIFIVLLIFAILTKDLWMVLFGGGYSFPIK